MSAGACGPGIIAQSATESCSVRPAVPPNGRSGIGRRLRSGSNLCIASARESLSGRSRPLSSVWTTDLAGVPDIARSISRRSSPREMGDDAGGAAWQRLTDALAELALEPVVGELPDHGAARRTHRDRGEQLGLQQPDDEPHPGTPAEAVPAHVIAGADEADLTVLVVLHEDHALHLDRARLHQRGDGVEIVLGGVEGGRRRR